jgi:hypothetical protein
VGLIGALGMFVGSGLMLGDLLGTALDQLLMAGDLLLVGFDLLLMDGGFLGMLLHQLTLLFDSLLVQGNLPVVLVDLASVFLDLAQMHVGDTAIFLFLEQIDVLRLAITVARLARHGGATRQAGDGGAAQAESAKQAHSIDRHLSRSSSIIS